MPTQANPPLRYALFVTALFVTALFVTALFVAAACDSNQRPPTDPMGLPYVPRADAAPPAPDAGPSDAAWPDQGPPDAEPVPDAEPPDSLPFDQVPFDIVPRVGERFTPAGRENRVTCEVLDLQGAAIGGYRTVIKVRPDTGFERTDLGVIGEVARDYTIDCFAPQLGLRSKVAAIWTVRPGSTAIAVAEVDDETLDAGGETVIRCLTFDAFGNSTDARGASVEVDPPRRGIVRRPDDHWLFTAAGRFDVRCARPGAESAPGVPLRVRPGLPARIAARLVPDRPVYAVGSVVGLVPIVTDEHDNPIDTAIVAYESEPPLPSFGEGRFRPDDEGTYAVRVRVDEPTHNDRELVVEREIFVDFGGPGIRCDSPRQGARVIRPEGGVMTLRGAVADLAGVAEVLFDDVPIELGEGGVWAVETPVEWGLNVHAISAIDEVGQVNSALCEFLAADGYLSERLGLEDAVLLRLGQGAIDDGEPDAPLTSLADIFRRILNSAGLRDTAHAAASAQNPIVPSECHVRVLGVCLFRLGVDYVNLRIGGRNVISLTLVDGGLALRTEIRDVEVTADMDGTIDSTARIRTEHITIAMTFDINRRFDGRPSVSLRSLDEVNVGPLDANFSGFLTGAVLELVFRAFEGLIRRTIVDTLRDFVRDAVDSALEDLLSNIDLGELAQGVDVPGLADGEAVPLAVTARLSSLDFTPGQALIGVETRFDAPARVAGASPGVPLPPGAGRPPLADERTVGAGVQIALVNQALHALWRAGYFDVASEGLVGDVAADLPDGVEVWLAMPDAPTVVGLDGRTAVRVFVGPATAAVAYPGVFAQPFRLRVSAAVDAAVSLVGERDLVFDGIELSALHLGFGGAAVSEQARTRLEDTLEHVLGGIVDRALNDALPTLPLPDFEIPESLGIYGLPVGGRLGLRQPRLSGLAGHWILDGNFGE